MDEVNAEIGKNIRIMRAIRGLSTRQLCDRLADQGVTISSNTLNTYERGERTIPASLIFRLCRALECTVYNLYHTHPQGVDPTVRLLDEIRSLPEREQKILLFIASEWQGNSHTLVQFCGLYASLPPEEREDIAFAGIHAFEHSKTDPKIGDMDVDSKTVERGWRKLLKG